MTTESFKMSGDEDTELRDLVAQTLEANGVLGKIRAQLRASVFLALEEQESIQNKTPFANAELKKFVNTKDGRLVAGLVREFLEHFNMEFTLAVFDPESNIGDHYEGRGSLARDLDIADSEDSMKQPLLMQVLHQGPIKDSGRHRQSSFDAAPTDPTVGPTPDPPTSGLTSGSRLTSGLLTSGSGPPSGSGATPKSEPTSDPAATDTAPQELPSHYIVEARRKFDQYDTDNSGTIEKDELRVLFTDIFPTFHRNMLDRYVNDEFRAADLDMSNGIDFEEFLSMYKRLFVLCKSVVSNDVTDLLSSKPSKKNNQRKAAGGSNIVVNKNKRNLDNEKLNDVKHFQKQTNSFFNDDADDAFFDDPIPSNNNTKSFTSARSYGSPRRAESPTSPRPSKIPTMNVTSEKLKKDVKFDTKSDKRGAGAGALTSLADLPSLAPNESPNSPKSPGLDNDIKAIDRTMADLGFDVPDDDYDDDFESSKSDRSEKTRSIKSDKSGKSSGSAGPFRRTLRSGRSDPNPKSIEDELEEEIEEDLSGGDDLLKSDVSGLDDLTTDRTVSPDNQSTAIDYMEDVMVP